MRDVYLTYDLGDNGGRRIGIERRRFSYAGHIPERRCGEDRRSAVDRRTCVDRRSGMDRRVATDRRATEEKDRRETPSRRDAQERRVSDDRRRFAPDRRNVLRSRKASSLDADAPSAIVAQVECQVNVAHVKHQNSGDRIQ